MFEFSRSWTTLDLKRNLLCFWAWIWIIVKDSWRELSLLKKLDTQGAGLILPEWGTMGARFWSKAGADPQGHNLRQSAAGPVTAESVKSPDSIHKRDK